MVNAVFRVWNACAWLGLYNQLVLFFSSLVMGLTTLEQPWINYQQKFAKLRNCYSSLTNIRSFYFYRACTFLGSIVMLLVKIIKLRYFIFIAQNLDLLILIQSLALLSLWIISFIYFICSARVFEKIRTLLRYAVQQSLRALCKTQLIQFQNVAGVLQRLNSITNILQSPNRVINAVSHLQPSAIWIRLNAAITLSLVKYLALQSTLSILQTSSNRYQFLIVTVFRPQQLQQIYIPPPGFAARRRGTVASKVDLWIKPLSSILLIHFFTQLSLAGKSGLFL